MYLQAGFEYDRRFDGDHHLSGLLMYQQNTRSVLGQQAIYAQQLIAGRINYAYRQKYLLETVVSYNGSENYAKGNRFGVFPAASVGWVISNENFLKDNRTLNFLKLRLRRVWSAITAVRRGSPTSSIGESVRTKGITTERP